MAAAGDDDAGGDSVFAAGTDSKTPGTFAKLFAKALNRKSKRRTERLPSTEHLILEHRPMSLPAKSPEDIKKHEQMYERMMAQVRKKEAQALKKAQQKIEQQHRREDELAGNAHEWLQTIFPQWESRKDTKRTHELWWAGVPPNCRGRLWQLAMPNALDITPELYETLRVQARDRLQKSSTEPDDAPDQADDQATREDTVHLISLDIARTFPQLCMFQENGPYYETILHILAAFTCYRPLIGYVQGMSFLAGMLLLNMDEQASFTVFAHMLSGDLLNTYMSVDVLGMHRYAQAFTILLHETLPALAAHFDTHNVSPDLYLTEWIMTIFSKHLPLDLAMRVWDVYFRDGERFIFSTALGLLHFHQPTLLGLEFEQLFLQLKSPPPAQLTADALFRCIDAVALGPDRLAAALAAAASSS